MLSFPCVEDVDCLLRLDSNLKQVTIPVATYDVLQHTQLDNCSSKGKVHRSEQVTRSTEGARRVLACYQFSLASCCICQASRANNGEGFATVPQCTLT